MFILFGILGGLIGYFYANSVLPKILEEKSKSKTSEEFNVNFWYVILPSSLSAIVIAEGVAEAILGPSLNLNGHLGFWSLLELLPEWLFLIVIFIFSIAALFTFIAYIAFPIIFVLGLILIKLELLGNYEKVQNIGKIFRLSGYQLVLLSTFIIIFSLFYILL